MSMPSVAVEDAIAAIADEPIDPARPAVRRGAAGGRPPKARMI